MQVRMSYDEAGLYIEIMIFKYFSIKKIIILIELDT